MQNNSYPNGSVVQPVAPVPFGPGAPGTAPMMPGQANSAPVPQKHTKAIIILAVLMTLFLIATGVLAWTTFYGFTNWEAAQTNLDGQIDVAVARAVSENTTKLEAEFAEREKYPYKTFAGPGDYGSVTFQYPKTWSVYIAQDASVTASEFVAYFNPVEVQPISSGNVNALRMSIRTEDFNTAVSAYEGLLQSGALTLSVRNVGSTSANVYSGKLNENMNGVVTIFRIRDKVVTLQTDAAIFMPDYYDLLDTVTFIE